MGGSAPRPPTQRTFEFCWLAQGNKNQWLSWSAAKPRPGPPFCVRPAFERREVAAFLVSHWRGAAVTLLTPELDLPIGSAQARNVRRESVGFGGSCCWLREAASAERRWPLRERGRQRVACRRQGPFPLPCDARLRLLRLTEKGQQRGSFSERGQHVGPSPSAAGDAVLGGLPEAGLGLRHQNHPGEAVPRKPGGARPLLPAHASHPHQPGLQRLHGLPVAVGGERAQRHPQPSPGHPSASPRRGRRWRLRRHQRCWDPGRPGGALGGRGRGGRQPRQREQRAAEGE